MAKPYLHCHHRFKNGKDHCYWSIAEKVKTRRGWVQRHLLYLGEINDSRKASWTKATEVFDPVLRQTRELALYPADRPVPEHATDYGVQVRLEQFELRRPRQWGACWVACQLWEQLKLEEFWAERLPDSREQTCWAHIFVAFLAYCLHVHLRARLQTLVSGLTPRSLLEKFAAIQMLDVHFPTTDGRELVFARYTQPEKDHKLLLSQLDWDLPPQSPPRITQKGQLLKE